MNLLDVKVKVEYIAQDGSVHPNEGLARTRNWKLLERKAREQGLLTFDEWSWRFELQLDASREFEGQDAHYENSEMESFYAEYVRSNNSKDTHSHIKARIMEKNPCTLVGTPVHSKWVLEMMAAAGDLT